MCHLEILQTEAEGEDVLIEDPAEDCGHAPDEVVLTQRPDGLNVIHDHVCQKGHDNMTGRNAGQGGLNLIKFSHADERHTVLHLLAVRQSITPVVVDIGITQKKTSHFHENKRNESNLRRKSTPREKQLNNKITHRFL